MATPVRPSGNPSGRKVSPTQFLALVLAFVVLSVGGGVIAAGVALPVAAGLNTTTDHTIKIFDSLPHELEVGQLSEVSRMYAGDGKTILAQFYTENREVVPLDRIAPIMQQAAIAIEDKRFYEHGAIDIEGIPGAVAQNLTKGENRGASSLTQQYVKNVLIEKAVRDDDRIAMLDAKEPTLARKAREAKLAIALEQKWTKKQILEGYLNIAQFGTKVYGVEAAAQRYFSKSAKDLNYLEAATIAGITKSPSRYDPTEPKNIEKATKRRNIVLNQMYVQGYITKADYDTGSATPIEKTLHIKEIKIGCQTAGGAAFFCDYVLKEILSNPVFGKTATEREDLLYRGGLRVYTTIDLKKQAAAQRAAVQAVPPNDPSGLETSIVSVEPGTGKILAMAQNRPYDAALKPAKGTTAINYSADQAHGGSWGFSPGSTFKLFVLAQWLKEGRSLYESVSGNVRTWNTSEFHGYCKRTFGRSPWKVRNSEGNDKGNISVLLATADSVNAAFASMAARVDLCSVGDTAADMGYRPSLSKQRESGVEIVPAMILGTQNTSPLDQTNAYTTVASGGVHCNPIAITKIVGPDGKAIAVPAANCKRVLDERIANTITYALREVLTGPIATGHSARLAGGRPAAGKTGTSQESKHTWFVGYVPGLTTGVWVGNAETDEPHFRVTVNGRYYATLYGSSVAAPEWKAYMDEILAGTPVRHFGNPDWGRIHNPKPPAPSPTDGATPEGGDAAKGAGDGRRGPGAPPGTSEGAAGAKGGAAKGGAGAKGTAGGGAGGAGADGGGEH